MIPQVIERATQGSVIGYDIYSRLLKDRIIFVGGYEGEFTTDSANVLIAQLLYLDSDDDTKDINLYINSPGGMVTAGLAVYDTMQFIKSPITTICMGMAMSFGAVILAAGSKGKRYALPQSRIMIHQPLVGGISGQATDILLEAKEMAYTRKTLEEIMARHTGQPMEKITRDMERNYYMSAEEAKAYGIIDEVIVGSKLAALNGGRSGAKK
ncbi:MAG: ATP-dependent Clp protease proteolytic subunit [Elusimicrobia bacterium]|nr:ATP-dependent Clp protease proteolytic subunit [Elusimicrobiota bacterium]MDE2424640.1 ATP-dependent Clp protease proteolytic subunit [Elusimicrobiota bacterium]